MATEGAASGATGAHQATLRARMVDGTARVFLAEALIAPTGLLTVAYLTRRLGPADYGRYTLAVSLIIWLEYGFTAPFARAGVRVIGAADDWMPVASLVVRTQFAVGALMALGLYAAAPLVAGVLHEPALTSLLRLFSLDLPLFALAQGHQQVLVALGRFRARALVPLVRWTVRLALIVIAVEAGLSTHGVALAVASTSAIETWVSRRFVRPPIFRSPRVPVKPLFDYALPLLFATLSLRIFDRVDVMLLKLFGRSAAEIGIYGAAQSLTLATGLFAIAFSPLLLATITRAIRGDDLSHARQIARDAERFVVLLLPLAAILAASAGEIAALVFGPQYLSGVTVFQCLIFAGLANVGISVGSAILIGAGKPRWTLMIAMPLPVIAIAAHVWAIPRYGSTGAAVVTMICAMAGAGIGFAALHRIWHVAPPLPSVARSALLAAAGAAAAAIWPAPGIFVLAKIGLLCFAVALVLLAAGEFGSPRKLLESARRVFLRVPDAMQPDV